MSPKKDDANSQTSKVKKSDPSGADGSYSGERSGQGQGQSTDTSKSQGREKRKSARLEINAITRYVCNGEEFVGLTKLINLGGLLIEVDEPLALGTNIRVELNLPISLRPFSGVGEVVYRNNIRGRLTHVASEMGIKFLEINEEGEALLLEFTERYSEFNQNHSVFSKEMSAFNDPTIIKAPRELTPGNEEPRILPKNPKNSR